jgi:hypothetical protein
MALCGWTTARNMNFKIVESTVNNLFNLIFFSLHNIEKFNKWLELFISILLCTERRVLCQHYLKSPTSKMQTTDTVATEQGSSRAKTTTTTKTRRKNITASQMLCTKWPKLCSVYCYVHSTILVN